MMSSLRLWYDVMSFSIILENRTRVGSFKNSPLYLVCFKDKEKKRGFEKDYWHLGHLGGRSSYLDCIYSSKYPCPNKWLFPFKLEDLHSYLYYDYHVHVIFSWHAVRSCIGQASRVYDAPYELEVECPTSTFEWFEQATQTTTCISKFFC